MIFLIEYNRGKGKVLTFEKFRTSERITAEKKRLELELNLNKKNVRHEVVLLEAATEKALKRTHRRYFESSYNIAKSIGN